MKIKAKKKLENDNKCFESYSFQDPGG